MNDTDMRGQGMEDNLDAVAYTWSVISHGAWLFPHRCFYSIGRGSFPLHLEIPLSGQLLWGSCGTPHNEFLGRAQVLPIVEAVRDLCPQRLQICLYLV